MRKKIARFSVLPVLVVFVFYGFSAKEKEANTFVLAEKYDSTNRDLCYTVPQVPENFIEFKGIRMYPKLSKAYIAFREAMGFAESSGNYLAINDYGYLGKYQFGRGTLDLIGIENIQHFLAEPKLQEAAFYANASRNKWILQRDIARFENKIINGITITESGILAAAHLAGPGNVKKYLRSSGNNSFRDGFGTSIGYYFKKFGGYDTSFIKPVRLAKAQ